MTLFGQILWKPCVWCIEFVIPNYELFQNSEPFAGCHWGFFRVNSSFSYMAFIKLHFSESRWMCVCFPDYHLSCIQNNIWGKHTFCFTLLIAQCSFFYCGSLLLYGCCTSEWCKKIWPNTPFVLHLHKWPYIGHRCKEVYCSSGWP